MKPVDGCICGCCADARERIRCGGEKAGLSMREACWCWMYKPEEYCECEFCIAVLAAGRQGAN